MDGTPGSCGTGSRVVTASVGVVGIAQAARKTVQTAIAFVGVGHDVHHGPNSEGIPPVGFAQMKHRFRPHHCLDEFTRQRVVLLENGCVGRFARHRPHLYQEADEQAPLAGLLKTEQHGRSNQRSDYLFESRRPVPGNRCERFAASSVDGLGHGMYHRLDQLFLGAEVIVNGGNVHAGRLGDLTQGGCLEPPRAESPQGGKQNARTRGVV